MIELSGYNVTIVKQKILIAVIFNFMALEPKYGKNISWLRRIDFLRLHNYTYVCISPIFHSYTESEG